MPRTRKTITKTCTSCGELFTRAHDPRRPQKYCSRSCHLASVRTPEKVCPTCKRTFHEPHRETIYCSIRCFNLAKLSRRTDTPVAVVERRLALVERVLEALVTRLLPWRLRDLRDDARSEGIVALVRAAQLYDEDGSAKFTSYAWFCARGRILKFVRREIDEAHVSVESLRDQGWDPTLSMMERRGRRVTT